MEDPVQQVEALDVSDARRSEKTQHARTTLHLCLLTVCFALVLVPFKSPLGLPDRTIRSRNVPTQNSDRSLLHTPRMCSANEVVGNFINTTFFGIDGCVLHFVDVPSHFSALVDGTKKRLWIHFVGDSDTRGLVLGLLRFLYTPLRTAVTRDEFAKAYGCWDESIGSCPGIDMRNLARLGYIDFQFLIEAGVLKNQKAFVRGGYSKDVQDLRADYQYGLRISYTFEGRDGEREFATRPRARRSRTSRPPSRRRRGPRPPRMPRDGHAFGGAMSRTDDILHVDAPRVRTRCRMLRLQTTRRRTIPMRVFARGTRGGARSAD